MKGIWIHQDRQGNRERALRWATPRCNHANMYIGYKDRVKQIDTRCAACGKRVRFTTRLRDLADRRGNPSQALWISRPRDTRKELEAKVAYLNGIDMDPSIETRGGFVTALELMKNKSPRTMGGELE